jgi:hypothetical protein
MAKTLDRSKDFGEIFGGGRERFEQGGCYFDATGQEIVAAAPKTLSKKEQAAEEARLVREKEEAELAAAIAAEEAAEKSLLDEQLDAQAEVTGE